MCLRVYVYSCDGFDSLNLTLALKEGDRDLGTYCGSKFPPAVMSANQRLDVFFISRRRPVTSSKPQRGFNASYHFVTSRFYDINLCHVHVYHHHHHFVCSSKISACRILL